jgi:translation initiation factor IF-3
MAHPELGQVIMNRCAEACADCASVEKPAKLEGRQMLMFLAPKSSK